MTTQPGQIPQHLADALAREIDPGEKVLWAGMPSPRRFARRWIPYSFLFAMPPLFIAFVLLAEVLEHDPAAQRQPWWMTGEVPWVTFGFMGGCLLLITVIPIVAWYVLKQRARGMIYAITPTRVVEICVSRQGRTFRVKSLEPSHPLDLARHDYAEGDGDLNLYPHPSGQGHGKLSLIGVQSPREVERVLRQAFNPA